MIHLLTDFDGKKIFDLMSQTLLLQGPYGIIATNNVNGLITRRVWEIFNMMSFLVLLTKYLGKENK